MPPISPSTRPPDMVVIAAGGKETRPILLLENGNYLLLENGNYLLLESG